MAEIKNAHKSAALVLLIVLISLAAYFSFTSLAKSSQDRAGSAEPNRSTPVDSREVNGSQQQQPFGMPARVGPSTVDLSSQEPTVTAKSIEPIETIVPASTPSINLETTAQQSTTTTTTTTAPPTTASSQATQTSELSLETKVSSSSQQILSLGPSTATTTPDYSQTPVMDRSLEELGQWEEFKRKYGRVYANEQDELRRQNIFFGNLRYIKAFNEHSGALFKLAINHFGDLSVDEINQLYVGPQTNWTQTIRQLRVPIPIPMRILADSSADQRSVDWRNLTSPPVDQGTCRESSIFALVASLEAAANAASRQDSLAKFSEQQVIDCVAKNGGQAPDWPPVCQGDLSMVQLFDFLSRSSIPLATAQEYAAFRQQSSAVCQLPMAVPERPKLGSYRLVHRNNIREAVLNVGPLVVALDASRPSFHFYKSGLYHEEHCSSDNYNTHALIVAYSSGEAGDVASPSSSYTIRTSFGLDWGEAGHMRLLEDENRNKCLPQQLAIYPNLAY